MSQPFKILPILPHGQVCTQHSLLVAIPVPCHLSELAEFALCLPALKLHPCYCLAQRIRTSCDTALSKRSRPGTWDTQGGGQFEARERCGSPPFFIEIRNAASDLAVKCGTFSLFVDGIPLLTPASFCCTASEGAERCNVLFASQNSFPGTVYLLTFVANQQESDGP